ncbi:MAG: hypothetical protein H6670_16745 [Anaerolineaceae bacterium]|nr:hypothetical protein [Anaerolineaceae bacterium]
MKRYILTVLLLLVFSVTGYAQDTTNDEPTPTGDISAEAPDFGFVATVEVDSGFVRLLPSEDAEAVASVFVDERLEVISRNLDGTWFEVRRPGRMTNLGWVFTELLDWEGRPEFLPLGDAVTGLTSDSASPITTDYAVFIIEGVALRNGPILERSQRLLNIPPSVVVPVLARNQDGSRLYVNYLGTEGWIVGFTARQRNDIMQVPQAPNLPPLETIQVFIVPPEIQLEQIETFRVWTQDKLTLAQGLESFWWSVFRGEILPCQPPPEIAVYLYDAGDVQQLPELDRYAPRTVTGVNYLNKSINTMRECGVVQPDDVSRARNDAINARIIFAATLQQLDNLEETIR